MIDTQKCKLSVSQLTSGNEPLAEACFSSDSNRVSPGVPVGDGVIGEGVIGVPVGDGVIGDGVIGDGVIGDGVSGAAVRIWARTRGEKHAGKSTPFVDNPRMTGSSAGGNKSGSKCTQWFHGMNWHSLCCTYTRSRRIVKARQACARLCTRRQTRSQFSAKLRSFSRPDAYGTRSSSTDPPHPTASARAR